MGRESDQSKKSPNAEEIQKKILKGTAYRIFFDEVKSHGEFLKGKFDKQSVPLSDEIRSDLNRRAHTIKGGAGFFQMTRLGELSGKLEHLLEVQLSDEQFIEAQKLVLEMCQLIDKMEPPSSNG